MTLLLMYLATISVLGAICFGQLLRLRRYEQEMAAAEDEVRLLRDQLMRERCRRMRAEAISATHSQQLLAANSWLVMAYREWKT
jgi:hypothetical protein